MNSILSIVLAFLFIVQVLVPGMDLCCELEKLPSLYEHYSEHASHDGTSMMEFLKLHYGDDPVAMAHLHDDKHDSELPFHGDHKCHHAPFYYALEHQFLITQIDVPKMVNYDHYTFFLKSEIPDTPFLPPRV